MTTVARRRPNPVADLLNWLESESSFGFRSLGTMPDLRLEDYMDGSTYVLRAELPGINPDEDLEMNVDGDILTIRGERQEEHKERNRSEFHYGAFSRSVTLPRKARTDEISAAYLDGVLEVRVPLESQDVPPRRIPVQRGTEQKS